VTNGSTEYIVWRLSPAELDLQGILSSPPLQILRYADEQFCLYNKQGEGDAGLARMFLDAAQISVAHGDCVRGRVFTKKKLLMHGGQLREVTLQRWLCTVTHHETSGSSL
jgi:hypothetical protein